MYQVFYCFTGKFVPILHVSTALKSYPPKQLRDDIGTFALILTTTNENLSQTKPAIISFKTVIIQQAPALIKITSKSSNYSSCFTK